MMMILAERARKLLYRECGWKRTGPVPSRGQRGFQGTEGRADKKEKVGDRADKVTSPTRPQ